MHLHYAATTIDSTPLVPLEEKPILAAYLTFTCRIALPTSIILWGTNIADNTHYVYLRDEAASVSVGQGLLT
jgi:hypothetical protein